MLQEVGVDIIAYIKRRKLSDGYKDSLISAISRILDYSYLPDKVYYHADISDMVVLAQGKLRSARAKATFDDLCVIDYTRVENMVLNYYKQMLYRRAY